MQNQNTRLAAQLVTRQIHPGRAYQTTNVQPEQPAQQSQHSFPQQRGQPQLNDSLTATGEYQQGQEEMGHTNMASQPGPSYLQTNQQGNIASSNTQDYPQGHPFTNQPETQESMSPGPGSYAGVDTQVHEGDLKADFTDIYRTGNFGTHFGKVNVPRGKRWLLAHAILSSLMIVLTLVATIMMSDYTNTVFKDMLLAFTWMTSIDDWMLVASAAFFMFKLSTLKNPLTTLMIVRTFSAISFTLNLFFFLVGLLGLLINEKDFVGLTPKEVGFLKSVFVMITILMAAKTITGYSFVFMWWKNPACCGRLATYCVFDEGEEIAPGVANSAGTQNIIAFGQAAAEFGNAINRA